MKILENKMVFFEDVKNQSTEEYFYGNQFSIDAWLKKYTVYEGETYVHGIKRVCDYIASVEKTDELKKYWSERWFDEIYCDWWHPAGSIIQGAENPNKISMQNCTTIAMPHDSLEGIFKYNAYRVAKMAAFRQGLGVDFSKLRPAKMKLNNSANISEGAIHWMRLIDSIGYYVGQKGRIPAMLFSLSISHPDVEDFITVKSDKTKIQNANISVQCTDKFYRAVENDEDFELKFEVKEIKKGDKIYLNPEYDDVEMSQGKDENGHYYLSKFHRAKDIFKKSIKAKKLLELIAKNMYANAEPGIQNIDIAKKYSNSDCVGFPILSTNACSEQYLDDNGNCNLGSINCEKFYKDNDINTESLKKTSESIVRFLDNVLSKEIDDGRYATPKQKRSIEGLRRIGAGITNIDGLLLQKNLLYGEKEGNAFIEKFSELYNYYCYKTSIALGKEKGSFNAFDKENYLKSPFVKNMIRRFPDLEFNTMRNVCVTSYAPTGTLSLMFRDMVLSYGIEPGFALYYWKRTRIAGHYEYYFVVPNIIRKLFKEKGFPIDIKSDTIKDTWDGKHGKSIAEFIETHKLKVGLNFKGSLHVNPMDKLDLMSRVMKNVDSSISVTYMLPENSSWKDVYNFILEAWKKEIKSIAAFPDKKMYGIVSFVPFKELAFKLKVENIEMHPQNFSTEELAELNISDENIIQSSAPKRPKELEADVYSIAVKGEKFVVVVGLLNNAPYEIFGGHMNGLNFKFQHKKGKVIKVIRGQYQLEMGDFVIDDFSQQFTPVETIVFRLISTSLRHGVSIKFIVEQLQKATDDINSLASACARVLKKYITEGETVSGIECPQCHASHSIFYKEGCMECMNCQWTRCQ